MAADALTLHIAPDAPTSGTQVAEQVLQRLSLAAAAGRRFLLGCPVGRSFAPAYAALADLVARRAIDLRPLTLVMMDEYLDPTAADAELCRRTAHYSCRRACDRTILRPLAAAAPRGRGLAAAQVWFPDPRDPRAYDARIADAGGVDLFLVASGSGDGHVAFNPPGSTLRSRTRVIDIAESTRADNLRTFPRFRSLAEVPRRGVSVGLATLRGARMIAMMLCGREKRRALRRLLACADFQQAWPASVVHRCRETHVYCDRHAFGDARAAG
jgi:glucosamine-6-phosphate deaminase